MFSSIRILNIANLIYMVSTLAAIWFLTSAPLPIPLYGTHSIRFASLILSLAVAKCLVDVIGASYPHGILLLRGQLQRYRFFMGVIPISLAVITEYLGTSLSDAIASVELGWWIRHLLRCGLSITVAMFWIFFIPIGPRQQDHPLALAKLQSLFPCSIISAVVITNLATFQQWQEQLNAYRLIDAKAYPVRALRQLQCIYEIDDCTNLGEAHAKERIIELMDQVVALRQRFDRLQASDSGASKEQLILKLALDETTVSQNWIKNQSIYDQEYFLLGGLLLQNAKAWDGLLDWTSRAEVDPRLNLSDAIERLRYWRCLSLAKLGRIEQAIEAYESAIELSSTPSDQLLIELAVLYSEQGDVHRAIELLRAVDQKQTSGAAVALIRRLRTNSCILLYRPH